MKAGCRQAGKHADITSNEKTATSAQNSFHYAQKKDAPGQEDKKKLIFKAATASQKT